MGIIDGPYYISEKTDNLFYLGYKEEIKKKISNRIDLIDLEE